jgi:hypothetical protein
MDQLLDYFEFFQLYIQLAYNPEMEYSSKLLHREQENAKEKSLK